MGIEEAAVNSIMSGIENTGGVKQHNHKKKLRQRFDIIKKLGQGTFGKVQLGINKETGQEVAIKTIKKSKIESDADLVRIRREIQIMSSVQHPNIIHIYEVFENREKMVLVMEYAAGGELYDYLSERKVLLEDEARRIFRQIATACYYCHKHKICHRDLKLENILLDENNNAKIADFGLSNVFDDQRLLNTFCGSPLYASPEIVKGTPYHGPEVDCWSLGVLLYTLVYGAMPFDGSNFKRLVKQISQGDYYEPSKPSPASSLIRDMLTVNPKNRAGIEKICSHWWVNETYNVDCLEISEELANQTPVRLDVLLSLAPPAPQLESEKLLVTGDQEGNSENTAPTRSQSVGSLMELSTPERRIMDLINEEKFATKRKLESTLSTDRINLDKRRDKIIKENTIADISVHGSVIQEDANMNDDLAPSLNKSLTQTITKDIMEVDPSIEGAACQEILEEVKVKETTAKKSPSLSKIKRTQSTVSGKVLEGINEIPSQENLVDKENQKLQSPSTETSPVVKKSEEKVISKKKVIKKKVLLDKNENEEPKEEVVVGKEKIEKAHSKENGSAIPSVQEIKPKQEKPVSAAESASAAAKPTERRKSRIFEAAEKFQNLISPTESKPAPTEKPKKILLPDSMVTQQGVSVDGFKKEFERKSSLTSSTPVKPKSTSVPKRTLIDKPSTTKTEEKSAETAAPTSDKTTLNKTQEGKKKVEIKTQKSTTAAENKLLLDSSEEVAKGEEDFRHHDQVKNAVNIISNALDKEGTRKSKSRPSMMRKPPVPFGVSGRSASGNIGTITPLSPPIQNMGPKPFIRPCYENNKLFTSVAEAKQVKEEPTTSIKSESAAIIQEEPPKTSSAEITLKSATLPRRKTTKAQIQLNYPSKKPVAAQMEFRTEAAHNVEAPTQQVRSEVVVPVNSPISPSNDDRSSKERIIPIAFEKKLENGKEPAKPPMPRPFQTQKSNISQRSNSLSRQSTQDSDSETTTSTGEPIKKSPREYIIPIAVEGGGYVTPRAGSLEPSETTASSSVASTMTNRSKSKFGLGARRLNSLLSDRDSEDDTPFATLHRHSSFGKESDNEDSNSKGNFHHMHRLRRIRPKKSTLEHNDSVSSGEEDDDDGFEILTAENLFSTLLSRVRDLTQRLNVEDGVRPGFPSSSRLMSHFDHGTNFWNRMDHPLTRHSSLSRTFGRPNNVATSSSSSTATNSNSFNVPWRRSVSKDLASDIESVFNEQNNHPGDTLTARIPRGDDQTDDDNNNIMENLNLAELDLNKLNLSAEDQLALSHLTPGLSRRIQKQLLAQLTPAEVRKLHRTLSSKTSDEIEKKNEIDRRRKFMDPRMSCTLPRRITASSSTLDKDKTPSAGKCVPTKSFLPVKFGKDETIFPDFSVRSSSIGAEPKNTTKFYSKPINNRSSSSRITAAKSDLMHAINISPESSSISESLSKNDESASSSYRKDSDSSSSLSHHHRPSFYSRFTRTPSPNLLSPTSPVDLPKCGERKSSTRRISRFLRPDFFETPKEENILVKEKKERERETQQVLKEIRDKRKSRLRSLSRNREEMKEKIIEDKNNVQNDEKPDHHDYVNVPSVLLDNKDDNNSEKIHDYVNVKIEDAATLVNKKKEIEKKPSSSRLARPKSYPTENIMQNNSVEQQVEIKTTESKISKLRKGFIKKPSSTSKEDKNETNKCINEEEKAHKNKLLQSIEKKLEKFRSSSNSIKDTTTTEDSKNVQIDKKSVVDNAIKKLREQSLPRNLLLEPCTESGLIKRAVSVEDLSKPTLQTSRKSVTKILGLFKKYEEQDKKKPVKKTKSKEEKLLLLKADAAEDEKEKVKNEEKDIKEIKKPRPKSLLLDKVKHFQGNCNGTKTTTTTDSSSSISEEIIEEKPANNNKSKLPVNSFRRSLNLDNLPKTNKAPSESSKNEEPFKKPDRQKLKLDLTKIPSTKIILSNNNNEENDDDEDEETERKINRNSLTTTDDSSTILSPTEDYLSCDSWSACSDYHHLNDSLHSPQSQNNGNLMVYSGDENESVIDRIRRKSFYTRFNEKKKPRKSNLDLYGGRGCGDYLKSTTNNNNTDYNSLDRYRSPSSSTNVTRRISFTGNFIPSSSETTTTTASRRNSSSSSAAVSSSRGGEFRPYTRSASVLNDYVNIPGDGNQKLTHSYQNVPGQNLLGHSYQNLPGSYQTFNSRIARPNINNKSLYSDSSESHHLDDSSSSLIRTLSRSPYNHRSATTLERSSISPVNGQYSSILQSPTTSEPI